jgi:hypothetical protein
MKRLNLVLITLLAAIAGVGVAMAVTNPSQAEYEEYATRELSRYLRRESRNICSQVQVPDFLESIVGDQCPQLLETLVRNNRDQLQALISEGTERQNYGVLSLYRTDLEVSPLLPGYQFESVGVFRQFFTYKAERL